MFTIEGKYDTAKVFASNLEEQALSQIYTILNHQISIGAHTRIMADAHAGKGCVIGYTAKITDKIIPNLIGVDIGCGVLAVRLKNKIEDLKAFDEKVKALIPTGNKNYLDGSFCTEREWKRNVRDRISAILPSMIHQVCEDTGQDFNFVIHSLGTLGGGNHFCELGLDGEGKHWFIVHSGSRNFGYKIADYWQNIASKNDGRADKIAFIKKNYEGKEIEERIKAIPKEINGLEYLEGYEMSEYLSHAFFAEAYAESNRWAIVRRIFDDNEIDLKVESVHNYIDIDNGIIRKGAISAQEGEGLIIPLNMRDGCIIGIGKGNEDYNFSAPHGAGRKLARGEAKRTLSMERYEKTMEGIYSSCITQSTLDESPMAYKDKKDIIDNITDTVEIQQIVKPVWNFKAT